MEHMMPLRAVCLLLAITAAGAIFLQDPNNWSEQLVWSGDIGACVKLVTAANGQAFCASKDGTIRRLPSLDSHVNESVLVWSAQADLTATWGDRGMLGMAIDPNYPTNPYIFILMSVRRLENPATDNIVLPGSCNTDDADSMTLAAHCDEAARFYRLKVTDDTAVIDQLLMSGWCSNGYSNNVGNLEWARDGGLYLSGGDGASSKRDDRGTPGKPCHRDDDPRFQGVWRSQWDEYTHGKVLYVNKNALYGTALLTIGNGARIVAKGLRDPFRFAIHPVTHDLYIGDPGSDFWEEINVVKDPLTNNTVPNFGWPCFEGNGTQARYGADAGCSDVERVHSKPFITYQRSQGFRIEGAQEYCMRGTVAVTTLMFMNSTNWGSEFRNRLFWADSSMQCLFVLANDDNGLPSADTTQMKLLVYNGPTSFDGEIVGLTFNGTGSDMSLYALEFNRSQIFKINYLGDKSIDSPVKLTSSRAPPSLSHAP